MTNLQSDKEGHQHESNNHPVIEDNYNAILQFHLWIAIHVVHQLSLMAHMLHGKTYSFPFIYLHFISTIINE